MNCVIIAGHLGLDPETRTLPNGAETTRLRIAVNEFWHDKNTREKQKRTHWVSVNAWGRQAEVCAQYLHKGSKVLIRGSLEYREWEGRDGGRRSVVEIRMQEMEMLDSRSGNSNSQPARPVQQPQSTPFQSPTQRDDDIPF